MEIWQNGKIWEKVEDLMKEAQTSGIENSELGALLKDAAGYDSMLYEEKQAFMEELVTNFGNAYTYKNTDYSAAGGKVPTLSTTPNGNPIENPNEDPKEADSQFTTEDYNKFKNLGLLQ